MKKITFSISAPPEMKTKLERDAAKNTRTLSNYVVWIVEQHYERQREKERKDVQANG